MSVRCGNFNARISLCLELRKRRRQCIRRQRVNRSIFSVDKHAIDALAGIERRQDLAIDRQLRPVREGDGLFCCRRHPIGLVVENDDAIGKDGKPLSGAAKTSFVKKCTSG